MVPVTTRRLIAIHEFRFKPWGGNQKAPLQGAEKPLSMDAAEFSRFLASRQIEMTRFLTEMGLALKK